MDKSIKLNPFSKIYQINNIIKRILFIEYPHTTNQILSKMNQQFAYETPNVVSPGILQRPVEYTSIDFDDAHNHWIQNKRKLSNGMYRYICIGFFKNGNQCNRNPLVGKNACKIHDFPQHTATILSVEESKTNCDEQYDEDKDQTLEEDLYYRPIEITKTQKPQPKNTAPNKIVRTPERRMSVGVRGLSGDGLPSKDNEIKQRVPITRFVKSLWKTYRSRTFPMVNPTDNTKMNGSKKEQQDPIIDTYKETIRVYNNPLKYAKFKDLQKAFNKYGSIDKVRNPETIYKNRYNIVDVAYYLQMMLLFMEGLDEMTLSFDVKFIYETPKVVSSRIPQSSNVRRSPRICQQEVIHFPDSVMQLKKQLLMFVNYDTNTYLCTTESKWQGIRNNIRDEILYVLDEIFDEIGE